VEAETNAYLDKQAELNEQAEINKEELAQAAFETLQAIDVLADRMMQGQKYYSPKDENGFRSEYSLQAAAYTDDDAYISIELRIAQCQDVLIAAYDLKQLMFKYCREEAAMYLGTKICRLEEEAAHLLKAQTETQVS